MIRHHIVDEEDLISDFKEHAEMVRELKGLSNEAKLEFYGLYKQATVGPCNSSRPSLLDLRGQAKFDAWKELGDLSQSDAMLLYIDLYNSLNADQLKNTEEEEVKIKMSTLYNPEGDDPENSSDMWYACRHGNSETVQQNFAEEWRSARDDEGRSLVHWAVDRDHEDLVIWLLRQGCSADDQDTEGSTPLHYAVTCEHQHIIELLLKHGARTDLKDCDGNTALQLCDSNRIRECFDKLKIT